MHDGHAFGSVPATLLTFVVSIDRPTSGESSLDDMVIVRIECEFVYVVA